MKNNLLEGTLKIGFKGRGMFTTIENPDEVIEIEPEELNTAMHRDTVEIDTETKKVTRIVSRYKEQFVGVVYKRDDGRLTVIPDDRKAYLPFWIKNPPAGTNVGDKVILKLGNWPDPVELPEGEIIKNLGKQGVHEVEIQSIVAERGLPVDFPIAVDEAAEKIAETWKADLEEQVKTRRDFRGITTFTIDPLDAKDFDDALSIREISPDLYEIGIHIADVSHYVRPETILDGESSKRATSIYLVDRTIPMLPEVLSNEICSLKPNEDRLAFSAVFEITTEGKIKNEWFGKTIIHSDKRFTYEEAQEILTAGTGLYFDELNTMNKIAKILRAQNKAAGAISFEDSEIKFKLDNEGRPIEVIKKVRTDTNLMIEDFMLLANRKVAHYAHEKNDGKDHSFVYRIHDTPNIEKLQSLAVFLKPLGYDLKIENDTISATDLNELLAQAEIKEQSHIINRAAVRAMAKAVYSTRNIGHWGLAFEYYTHFTSPIRRYPDLMVHRLLEIYLKGEKPSEKMLTAVSRQVIHSTDMEIRAAEAERESIKFKQVEFLASKVGQTFDAIISGVTEWGLFVEEDTAKGEGMVRLSTLSDDFYEFDEPSLSLIGRANKKRYRLGDKIKVKLLKADVIKRQLDFGIVE